MNDEHIPDDVMTCPTRDLIVWVRSKTFGNNSVILARMTDEYDRLLSILTAAHADYCPYIHTCNGEQPDEYEFHDAENCPCAEWGAPCWYYKHVYKPMREETKP